MSNMKNIVEKLSGTVDRVVGSADGAPRVRRPPHRRRLASTDVVYVTASGATLIAAAPSGRPVRRLRSTVAWRPAVTG